MKVGDLVRTIKGNLALISKVDETVSDEWDESHITSVTLIYCDTGIQNCYCDARYLTLVQRG
jgi:hypothetical protein